jgi:hypothetical protein
MQCQNAGCRAVPGHLRRPAHAHAAHLDAPPASPDRTEPPALPRAASLPLSQPAVLPANTPAQRSYPASPSLAPPAPRYRFDEVKFPKYNVCSDLFSSSPLPPPSSHNLRALPAPYCRFDEVKFPKFNLADTATEPAAPVEERARMTALSSMSSLKSGGDQSDGLS